MLAVAALVLMIIKANDSYQLASAITYGVCLSLLYLGSTLYHSIPQPKIKAVLQKVDHCMIYLLIAGSYTPFTLIPLKGEWGWSLFGVSWGLAFLGIIQELTIGRKSEKRLLSMIIYVVMDNNANINTHNTHGKTTFTPIIPVIAFLARLKVI